MSSARAGTPGATRVCPHCKAIVLETATVCPGCRHHLRFSSSDALAPAEGYCAFNIEGTIAHKHPGEHCEYCIVLDIRNERGEQVIRQVVGVGALHPGELRRLSLAVEMLPARAAAPKADSARDERKSTASAPTPARAPVAAARPGPVGPAPAAAAPPTPASLGASPGATSRGPAPPPVQPAAPSKTAGTATVAGVGATSNPVAGRPAPAARGGSGETRSAPTQGNTDPSPLSPSPSGQPPLRIFRKP
jgi:hypothetical protein